MPVPPFRPEFVRQGALAKEFGIVEKPLGTWERLYNNGAVRKTVLLVLLAALWEGYLDPA